MKTKSTIINYVLLVFGVLILVNIISDRFSFRLDFTEDKRYTLSKATKNILDSIKEPITITAYFSEDLPPDVASLRRDFKDLLVEYASRSKGKINYEFVNPNENEEIERKAQQSGIQPVLINVRDKDQVKQQKAYIGAVVQLGERKEVIPFMQPGAAMEYALSSNIKKLTVSNKKTIGILQGHGEPTISSLAQADQALEILYNVEPITMSDSTHALDAFSTVAIIAPKDSFKSSQLNQLDAYLASGKNLFIAINRVAGDLQNAQGSTVNTGLENWLASKGITVNPNFLIDQNCANVTVNQRQGVVQFQSQVPFYYIPFITTFTDHPITKGLASVMMQFVSSITYTGNSNSLSWTALAKTSEKSGTEPSPTFFDLNRKWTQNDFKTPNQTVAGVLSGKIAGDKNSNIVIVSDGDFPINGDGQQARQIPADNVNLFVNAIDWLSDDTGLIDLRTKGIKSRPLDQIEDATRVFLKYFNFLLPILLIIGYGLFRMQMNRNLRMKRMENNYL